MQVRFLPGVSPLRPPLGAGALDAPVPAHRRTGSRRTGSRRTGSRRGRAGSSAAAARPHVPRAGPCYGRRLLVSQRALHAPARPLALPGVADGSRPDDVAIIPAARARPRVRARWLWAAGAIALLAGSAALVVWARTLPSFDAYGWLTWGQRTWHGGLDTNAAPSWKPLPYLFTVIYAAFGHHLELRLWMVSSAAVALAGVVFAGRIAYRLSAPRSDRTWAGWVAAAFAGAALLALRDELHYGYLHYVLSAQSDPMIVTFVLAAIDLALSGRSRVAFACGVLASLGRPEAWPLLALYSVWLWRERPAARWLITGGWVALAALWFGIPALSSRTPFVSAANALDSGRAPSGDRVTAVLSRFGELQDWPVYVAAALCVSLAALRRSQPRDRATLMLAGGVVAWVAIEIAFALHGWPALGRYMFEPAAVVTVLSGAFAGRALGADWNTIGSIAPSQVGEVWRSPPTPRAIFAKLRGGVGDGPRASARRASGRTASARTASGRTASSRTGAFGGALLVVALVAAMVPAAVSAVRGERSDLTEQHARTAEIEALPAVIDRLGGVRLLRRCGEPLTRLQYQSALAYALGDNVSQVGFKYSQALAHGNPVLFITPFESGVGWQVQAAHQTAPACAALPAAPTNL